MASRPPPDVDTALAALATLGPPDASSFGSQSTALQALTTALLTPAQPPPLAVATRAVVAGAAPGAAWALAALARGWPADAAREAVGAADGVLMAGDGGDAVAGATARAATIITAAIAADPAAAASGLVASASPAAVAAVAAAVPSPAVTHVWGAVVDGLIKHGAECKVGPTAVHLQSALARHAGAPCAAAAVLRAAEFAVDAALTPAVRAGADALVLWAGDQAIAAAAAAHIDATAAADPSLPPFARLARRLARPTVAERLATAAGAGSDGAAVALAAAAAAAPASALDAALAAAAIDPANPRSTSLLLTLLACTATIDGAAVRGWMAHGWTARTTTPAAARAAALTTVARSALTTTTPSLLSSELTSGLADGWPSALAAAADGDADAAVAALLALAPPPANARAAGVVAAARAVATAVQSVVTDDDDMHAAARAAQSSLLRAAAPDPTAALATLLDAGLLLASAAAAKRAAAPAGRSPAWCAPCTAVTAAGAIVAIPPPLHGGPLHAPLKSATPLADAVRAADWGGGGRPDAAVAAVAAGAAADAAAGGRPSSLPPSPAAVLAPLGCNPSRAIVVAAQLRVAALVGVVLAAHPAAATAAADAVATAFLDGFGPSPPPMAPDAPAARRAIAAFVADAPFVRSVIDAAASIGGPSTLTPLTPTIRAVLADAAASRDGGGAVADWAAALAAAAGWLPAGLAAAAATASTLAVGPRRDLRAAIAAAVAADVDAGDGGAAAAAAARAAALAAAVGGRGELHGGVRAALGE